MPWTKDNPPSFVKNKSKEEIEIAVDAANSILSKGGSEEDAIFGAISQVKAYNRKKSQQKAVESIPRSLPSHLLAVLNKAAVSPPDVSVEEKQDKPKIRKEFLGKNALPTDTQRNLVSVVLTENQRLVFTFDTAEQITTDLSSLNKVIEQYVSVGVGSSGGSAEINSAKVTVDTLADTPLIVEHNLGLSDPESLIVTAFLNGRMVDLDLQVMDSNSVEILTYVDTVNLRLNFVGI